MSNFEFAAGALLEHPMNPAWTWVLPEWYTVRLIKPLRTLDRLVLTTLAEAAGTAMVADAIVSAMAATNIRAIGLRTVLKV